LPCGDQSGRTSAPIRPCAGRERRASSSACGRPLRWRESNRRAPTPSPRWSRGRAMGCSARQGAEEPRGQRCANFPSTLADNGRTIIGDRAAVAALRAALGFDTRAELIWKSPLLGRTLFPTSRVATPPASSRSRAAAHHGFSIAVGWAKARPIHAQRFLHLARRAGYPSPSIETKIQVWQGRRA
jgi:hypothetical protein